MIQSQYAAHRFTIRSPFGVLVAVDNFLNALSIGLASVTACALVVDARILPLAAVVFPLCLGLTAMELLALFTDLGDQRRIMNLFRVMRPRSPISLETWLLVVYAAVLAIGAVWSIGALVGRGGLQGSAPRWTVTSMLLLATVVGALAMAAKGLQLSISAQPGWRDARWWPALHAISGYAMGAALLALLADAAQGAPSGLKYAASALFVATAALEVVVAISTARAARARYRAGTRITLGTLIVAGTLVPAALFVAPGSPAAVAIATGIALAAQLLLRLTLIGLRSADVAGE